jgi:hypothetical protein
MRTKKNRGVRIHSFVAVFVLAGVLAATAQDSTTLPDSPGTIATAQKAAASGSASESVQEQVAANSRPATPQTDNVSDQKTDQKPVGTAAAEKPVTTGVAASDAAGAAIAPAKQRRSRSLLIKVGAIIGAGVAVGTIAALSSASPNRPPGSH